MMETGTKSKITWKVLKVFGVLLFCGFIGSTSEKYTIFGVISIILLILIAAAVAFFVIDKDRKNHEIGYFIINNIYIVSSLIIAGLLGALVGTFKLGPPPKQKETTESSQEVQRREESTEPNPTNSPTEVKIKNNPPEKPFIKKIDYEVIKEKIHHNGAGKARVIVISPESVNEAELRLLAEQLRKEAENSSFEYIVIFDNKKAAEMRDHSATLKSSESKFYLKHIIGSYNKNPTGDSFRYSTERDPDAEMQRLEF